MGSIAIKTILSILAPLASQAFFGLIAKLIIKWGVNAAEAAVKEFQAKAALTEDKQDDVFYAAVMEGIIHIRQALLSTESK